MLSRAVESCSRWFSASRPLSRAETITEFSDLVVDFTDTMIRTIITARPQNHGLCSISRLSAIGPQTPSTWP